MYENIQTNIIRQECEDHDEEKCCGEDNLSALISDLQGGGQTLLTLSLRPEVLVVQRGRGGPLPLLQHWDTPGVVISAQWAIWGGESSATVRAQYRYQLLHTVDEQKSSIKSAKALLRQ